MSSIIKLWIASTLLAFGASSRAASIGLLHESPSSLIKLELREGDLLLSVRTAEDLPALYLTREMPGDGGDLEKAIEAVRRGEVPRNWVADWVVVEEEVPSVKLAVWTDAETLTYESSFRGARVTVPHVVLPRLVHEANGTQIFRVRGVTLFLLDDELLAFTAGDLNVGLVYQTKSSWAPDLEKKVMALNSFDAEKIIYESCEANLK